MVEFHGGLYSRDSLKTSSRLLSRFPYLILNVCAFLVNLHYVLLYSWCAEEDIKSLRGTR
jgi:hypothetical protein